MNNGLFDTPAPEQSATPSRDEYRQAMKKAAAAYRAERRGIDENTTVLGRHNMSQDAARAALGRSGSQRRKIYELVKAHPNGLTADEIQALTGFPVNSVNPRVNELANDGWLIDTGKRRNTRYDRLATVWGADNEL
jgi:Fic family protein